MEMIKYPKTLRKGNEKENDMPPIEKIAKIKDTIKLAEKWERDQEIPLHQIMLAALKDVRRVVNLK
jgi:hypothetical protein